MGSLQSLRAPCLLLGRFPPTLVKLQPMLDFLKSEGTAIDCLKCRHGIYQPLLGLRRLLREAAWAAASC